jgi:hypothetical protein
VVLTTTTITTDAALDNFRGNKKTSESLNDSLVLFFTLYGKLQNAYPEFLPHLSFYHTWQGVTLSKTERALVEKLESTFMNYALSRKFYGFFKCVHQALKGFDKFVYAFVLELLSRFIQINARTRNFGEYVFGFI